MKKIFKIILATIAILTVAVLVRFAMLGNNSKSGEAPGLASGTLTLCPDKPNCVCSEFTDDATHYIAPLDYSGTSPEKAWGDILQIIKESGGAISVANDEYIAATFSVSLFGFIDDVECRLDTSKSRIHIRSASRVGYSDLGVNKKRVDLMTLLFKQKMNGDL
ncbi:DUF1499 domain-containing protein [candidate division KSB1 bacterium]|nr:DUF1499 domain-containing protein [candidate division KSB1 bacterium]